MYMNDFSIKEINAYYARRGGMRTANISNYANAGSFTGILRQAASQRAAAAQEAAQTRQATQNSAAGRSWQTAQSGTTSQATRSTTTSQASQASEQSAAHQSDSSASAAAGNGNICCDKCQATNQLLVQMMSRNLYSQSALSYPLTGSASWTAYQNMANILNSELYS